MLLCKKIILLYIHIKLIYPITCVTNEHYTFITMQHIQYLGGVSKGPLCAIMCFVSHGKKEEGYAN